MHNSQPLSRREMLANSGAGFGAIALSGLLSTGQSATASPGPNSDALNPLAPKQPHFPATAKNVIFLFMEGGPSHLDLFDPKPSTDGPTPPVYSLVISVSDLPDRTGDFLFDPVFAALIVQRSVRVIASVDGEASD